MIGSSDAFLRDAASRFLEAAVGRAVFLFGADDEIVWAANYCKTHRVRVSGVVRENVDAETDHVTKLPLLSIADLREKRASGVVVLIADPNIFEVAERLREVGVELCFSSRLFIERYFDFTQDTTVRLIELAPSTPRQSGGQQQ